jgi:hypothetical protein
MQVFVHAVTVSDIQNVAGEKNQLALQTSDSVTEKLYEKNIVLVRFPEILLSVSWVWRRWR